MEDTKKEDENVKEAETKEERPKGSTDLMEAIRMIFSKNLESEENLP